MTEGGLLQFHRTVHVDNFLWWVQGVFFQGHFLILENAPSMLPPGHGHMEEQNYEPDLFGSVEVIDLLF